jgi:DNA polymerase IV
MKILCILLPHFPLECEIRRHPDLSNRPVVVLQPKDKAGSQKLVLDHSPELEGLQRNMPLQQALSRYGEAELVQADIPYYGSIFNNILNLLETKSPLVESFDLGQAYLGLGGLQLIYPDDKALVSSIKGIIPDGFAFQIGIAEGKFQAYLAALHSPPDGCRILTSDSEDFLKGLSCDVLPISIKSKDKLRDFGIRTLGQIVSLPAGPLLSQFGPEGRLISELARGYDATPLYPRFMEENVEESTVLSSVTVSLESILITVEALLSRVFARDSLRGRGIRRLTLWTRGWNSEHWEHNVQYKEPTMNIKDLISRIKQFLENFPQPGPVERVGIRVTGLGYRNGRQRSLLAEIRARDHLLDDIKQLESRLGSPQVFRIKEVEPWSRIPERRYVLSPVSR